MSGVPLHPALVHVPLGLAFVLPIVLVFVHIHLSQQREGRGLAWLAVVLAAIMVGGAFWGLSTGEDEAVFVERMTDPKFIKAHALSARIFVWSASAVLAAALGAALVPAQRWHKVLVRTTLVLALFNLYTGVITGHRGGILVYVHGAASAPRHLPKP